MQAEMFRIFVGGLSYDVDNYRLKDAFNRFGNVKKALVIRDSESGQSKGYGFITMTDYSSFQAALSAEVYIGGRWADLHEVQSKGTLKQQDSKEQANKIFIGGILQSTTDREIVSHFSSFGSVADCRILYDGKSGQSRGFCFLLFTDPQSVDRVFAVPNHHIQGKKVDIKRFVKDPQQPSSKPQQDVKPAPKNKNRKIMAVKQNFPIATEYMQIIPEAPALTQKHETASLVSTSLEHDDSFNPLDYSPTEVTPFSFQGFRNALCPPNSNLWKDMNTLHDYAKYLAQNPIKTGFFEGLGEDKRYPRQAASQLQISSIPIRNQAGLEAGIIYQARPNDWVSW